MRRIRKCDEFGYTTDMLCELLMSGRMLTEIAREWGVGIATLTDWIADDAERSARANDCRVAAGHAWDVMAVEALEKLGADATPGDIARARELASHYRWRASKISPPYREKTAVEHTGAGGGPIQTEDVTPQRADIAELISGAAGNAS